MLAKFRSITKGCFLFFLFLKALDMYNNKFKVFLSFSSDSWIIKANCLKVFLTKGPMGPACTTWVIQCIFGPSRDKRTKYYQGGAYGSREMLPTIFGINYFIYFISIPQPNFIMHNFSPSPTFIPNIIEVGHTVSEK